MTSPLEPVTRRRSGDLAALVRYVVGAALARTADAGAAVGLVLLAVERSGQLDRPVLVGSILTAAVGAPHLVGPLLARFLDRARDDRRLLAVAMVAYGGFLASAGLLLGRAPLAAVAALVVGAGLCGPLLTGGLSSRLAGLVGETDRARRRGEGWDALTYGLSGSVGPAVVATVATVASAEVAVLALSGAAGAGAVLVLTLPRAVRAPSDRDGGPTVAAVLRTLVRVGPLRRVSVSTVVTSVATGGLALLAVRVAGELHRDPSAGATMMAALGLGNLVGSLLVTLRPLRADPEKVMNAAVAGIGLTVAGCALATSLPVALVTFFLVGTMHAPYVAGSLGARSDYAPPGARAQVFVTVAALKITTGALGAPLVGLTGALDPRAVLAGCGGLVVLGAAGAVLDRRLSPGSPASAHQTP